MSFNPEYFYPTVITPITLLNGGVVTVYPAVKATDVYAAVDVTNVTQSPMGTTNAYQMVQLLYFILGTMGWKVYQQVLAGSPTNLTANYNNGASGVGATLTNSGTQSALVLDGQTAIVGGRYVINNQTSAFQNGIYTPLNASALGSATTNWILTRVVDFNTSVNILNNGLVYVLGGITYASTMLQDTFSGSITVGTTAINYAVWNFTS